MITVILCLTACIEICLFMAHRATTASAQRRTARIRAGAGSREREWEKGHYTSAEWEQIRRARFGRIA